MLQGSANIQCQKTNENKNVLWLVVSTHLKNISQNGTPPKVGVKTTNA